MSATNRGSERRKNDFYETPEEVTRDFLFNHLEGEFKTILEPCAGTGEMVRVLREKYPKSKIYMNEPFNEVFQTQIGADRFFYEEFQNLTRDNVPECDLIFTNPPYSQAQEIIEHALTTWPKAIVVMLLRVGLLESQKRHDWWQDKLPTELHILSKRPSFTGGGTDSACYAWFVWRPGVKDQKINVVWGR